MALAILDVAGHSGKLRFDIGKNRFYQYSIGKEKQRNRHGIDVIVDPAFVSPMHGPLPVRAMGRGELDPSVAHSKENRLIQLMSFRTRDRDGPAISRIVKRTPRMSRTDLTELPELALSQDLTMQISNHRLEVRPFNYQESQLSEPMFLNVLTGMLPKLLPGIGNLLGGLFGGGGKGAGRSSNADDAIQQLISAITKPEMIQQVGKLLSGFGVGGNAGGGAVAKARSQAMSSAHPARYSEAQIAPALLAALPALLPVLKQALNPQTLQAMLDAPSRHVGTLINGTKDIAKLGIESHEQDLKHLRELNPGVDDPALDKLLASLSLGVADMAKEVKYKRVQSVQLEFANIVSSNLFGRTVIPYQAGRELAFPMTVQTPKAFGNSMLDLVIKRADSLKIVHRNRLKLEHVTSGPLTQVPIVSEAVARTLEPNTDYVVSVTLVWKNQSGKKRGTSMQQVITLVGDYVFDRVEESSELIPLSDHNRFRDYWHKIWHGRFTQDFKRYELQLKYYYVLKQDRREHAKLKSLHTIEDGERRRTGRLKSGMDLSAAGLNRLLPQLRPGTSPLTDAELLPLTGGVFAERFNQCARYQAKLRGRPGDSAAIWVYPEVKLQRVVLQKVGETNSNGNVVSFTEHPVSFPIPAIVHFLGARSK